MINAKYRVRTWEHEFGVRLLSEKDFDSKVDADRYYNEQVAENAACRSAGCYYSTDKPVLVDADKEPCRG
jgi:hypothetical protein